jgi:hypothetical protein
VARRPSGLSAGTGLSRDPAGDGGPRIIAPVARGGNSDQVNQEIYLIDDDGTDQRRLSDNHIDPDLAVEVFVLEPI